MILRKQDMDKRVTISGLPETPREFGCWMDGGWQGARTLYERISPAHGVPVTRIGHIQADPGLRLRQAKGMPVSMRYASFDHFA